MVCGQGRAVFEIQVGAAGPEDMAAWVAIVNETCRRCPGAVPVDPASVQTYAVAGLAAPSEFLLVSLGIGEAPIGTVGLRRSGTWGIVSFLSVIQGMRQQGVGRVALREAVSRLGTPNVLAVCWPVEAYLEFFGRAQGWRLIGEYAKYAWDLSEPLHAMDRPLRVRQPAADFPLAGVPDLEEGSPARFDPGLTLVSRHLAGEVEMHAAGGPVAGTALRDALAWAADVGALRAGVWLFRNADDAGEGPTIAATGGHLARTWAVFERP